MSAFPMRCRFSEEHGTFSNGIALRQHYDANHPEYVPTTKARTLRGFCLECETAMTRGSFRLHAQRMHPNRNPKFVKQLPAKAPRQSLVVPTPVEPHPIQSVDDLVLPMIEVLAMPGNVVPVGHLAALFLWRDQTAEMLRTVRSG